MKPREQRRKVMLNARMRLGTSWGSARILNISSRGLLIESADAPRRGSYVEVRRGQHVIVARVVWTDASKFGLQTQDRLRVEEIIREPDRSAAPRAPSDEPALVERRSAARLKESQAQRFEASRQAARAFQFAAIAAFGTSAAIAGYQTVRQTLECPMSQVAAVLAHHQAPACGAGTLSAR